MVTAVTDKKMNTEKTENTTGDPTRLLQLKKGWYVYRIFRNIKILNQTDYLSRDIKLKETQK
jgi:hypothetical protein